MWDRKQPGDARGKGLESPEEGTGIRRLCAEEGTAQWPQVEL